MSLLLMFGGISGVTPSPPATFQCWKETPVAVSNFVDVSNSLSKWAYWETYAWTELYNRNRTWEYLSGNWFAVATTGTGNWSVVIEGSCPSI